MKILKWVLIAVGAVVLEPAPEPAATVAPQPAARDKAAAPRPKQRQGADMRHCLDRKDAKAIIRCAEPGRKP